MSCSLARTAPADHRGCPLGSDPMTSRRAVFVRRPVQRPRVPVWCATTYPNRRPLRRAARWDGLFPVRVPDPGALAEMAAAVTELRDPDAGPFELAITVKPGHDVAPWEAA